MELIECKEQYWEFVRTLRLDERVMDGFIKTDYITPEQQKKYMATNHQFFRIAIYNDKPAGFIGVINDDIRVCTHPDYQNLGIGKFMVNECLKIWPKAFAKVKIDNEASLKLFESCGFIKKYFILEKDDTQPI